MTTAADHLHMARALALAERGRGRTSPNPLVGAVVVDGEGVVVGQGAHQVAGGPHAEVFALAEAGEAARGATLYCTLEPCAHVGRTGPCAPRVVEAGIRRAVIAVGDPNPLVSGRGLAYLREGGVEVATGVLEAEAAQLNAPFFTAVTRGRPFVTMKIALSRDGCVAAAPGVRTALTGPAANRVIHRERAEVDALGVGVGTVLADDPLLTARGAFRARPLTRVVFDRGLRTPPGGRLLSTLDAGPLIIVGVERRDACWRQRAETLAAAGARILRVPLEAEPGFLPFAMTQLGAAGIQSLLLEGGPALHLAAWQAGIVDRVQIFTTPRELGPGAVRWLPPEFFAPDRLRAVRTATLGADEMLEGYVHRPD